MEKTSAHWISPSSIPLLCFGCKAKGNDRSSVIIGISIGHDLNFPVKGGGLEGRPVASRHQRAQSGPWDLLVLALHSGRDLKGHNTAIVWFLTCTGSGEVA